VATAGLPLRRINQDKPGHLPFLEDGNKTKPANGHIYIVYYDRPDYNDNQTDVLRHGRFSDGGNLFKERN